MNDCGHLGRIDVLREVEGVANSGLVPDLVVGWWRRAGLRKNGRKSALHSAEQHLTVASYKQGRLEHAAQLDVHKFAADGDFSRSQCSQFGVCEGEAGEEDVSERLLNRCRDSVRLCVVNRAEERR